MPLNYSIWDMVVWAVIFVLVWKILEWIWGFVSGFVYNLTHKRKFYHQQDYRRKPKYLKVVVICLLLIGGYYIISQGYGGEIIASVSEKVNLGVNDANTYQAVGEENKQSNEMNIYQEEKTTQKDIVDICKDDFNYYKDIMEKKYGASITLLKIEKIYDMDSAIEFFDTWSSLSIWELSSPFVSSGYEVIIEEYPVIMIAIRIKGDYGKAPLVVGCDHTGKLTEKSKKKLTV